MGTAAGSSDNVGVMFTGCCPEVSAGEEVIPTFVLGGTGSLGIGTCG